MKNPSPSPQSSQGKFISCNVKLEPHEIDTINFLVSLGKTVEQISPSNTPHNSQPDIFMDQLVWEMKSPTSTSLKSIEQLFYRATRQSPNVIFDLRRLKIPENKVIQLLEKLLLNSRKAKNLLIITKSSQLLDFRQKR